LIITFDLRPIVIKRAAIGNIQELEHLMRRKVNDEEFNKIMGIAIIMTAMMLHPTPALAVYQKGDIMRKAQPIIDVLKDAAEPVAYGMYIWSFIEYILGKRGEAKDRMKGTTWGFIGIQVLPWFFNIIKSVGEF